MNRFLPLASQTLLALAALALTGCFNNIGSTESSIMKNSQSKSSNLDDSGFLNETGDIHLDASLNSAMIGTYFDAGTNTDFGLVIDLKKGLDGAIGADSVQSILATVDTNSAIQQRKVYIHIPQFNIKAITTLGKLAAGNGKRLRNIMNIRPRFVRVDLTTSGLEIPENPSVLQLKNSNKTIITYGGKIEGDFVRRMSVLIPFAGANASFLPSITVPGYGDGYPSASPEETAVVSVKLVRVTDLIRSHFAKLITNVPYGSGISTSIQSESIRNISQTYAALALAVHKNTDTNKIEAAYFININPANTSGPETFPYCHSGYNNQDQPLLFETNKEFEFSHPLACECTPGATVDPALAGQKPPVYQYQEHCDVPDNKVTWINDALSKAVTAPTSGNLIPPTAPVSDIKFEVN